MSIKKDTGSKKLGRICARLGNVLYCTVETNRADETEKGANMAKTGRRQSCVRLPSSLPAKCRADQGYRPAGGHMEGSIGFGRFLRLL